MVHIYENDGRRSTARIHCRHASLLSVDTKIFEKLPNNRFVNHIKKCGLFSKFQYGVRSSQSIVFSINSNPARGVSEIRDGEDL